MALTNFSLPFGGLTTQNWAATISPLQPHHATAVNNLLYGPAGHQESDETPSDNYYKNNPYSLPQSSQFHSNLQNNKYLPPPPPQREQQSQYNPPRGYSHQQVQRTYGSEGNYGTGTVAQPRTPQYFNGYNTQTRTYQSQLPITPAPPQQQIELNRVGLGNDGTIISNDNADSIGQKPQQQGQQPNDNDGYPQRLPGFTRVQAGQGSRTQVHAVLDYDADEGDEEYQQEYEQQDGGRPLGPQDGRKSNMPTVTPIQGPIFIKNGTVPVVPLFSYPTLNNGTFVQIPIWWTALSVALGLDVRGDVIRGTPCVKRYQQLFCPTAGNSYPIEKIEQFIDDNKALMRRMYGDFEMVTGPPGQNSAKRKRSIDEPDFFDLHGIPEDDPDFVPDAGTGDTYFGKWREKRQSSPTNFRGTAGSIGGNNNRNGKLNGSSRNAPNPNSGNESSTGRLDACESKIEIVTPYWASNSAGKIRAIVNTQHFEQAIHQEICTKPQTSRCGKDCGCEQKYKWHRLLAYDPDNDCKGIFMDWFLFPSCCVCRCDPK